MPLAADVVSASGVGVLVGKAVDVGASVGEGVVVGVRVGDVCVDRHEIDFVHILLC